jgi:hypothetical protein
MADGDKYIFQMQEYMKQREAEKKKEDVLHENRMQAMRDKIKLQTEGIKSQADQTVESPESPDTMRGTAMSNMYKNDKQIPEFMNPKELQG